MIVPVPDWAFGICASSDLAGFQFTDAFVVFVVIVPVALPNVYLMVCVNDEDFLLVLIVIVFEPVGITDDGDTLG